ncbi:hypothetical protein GCM10027610_072100 [Dactylosporangium cerinum]
MRYADPGLHDGDAFVFKDRVEGGCVLAVAIADQIFHRCGGVLEVQDQVPGRLSGPDRGGVGGGAEDADVAGGVFDGGEDV